VCYPEKQQEKEPPLVRRKQFRFLFAAFMNKYPEAETKQSREQEVKFACKKD
jgi:hypothetical protein